MYYYHLFWDFEWVFFWFWQKNSQVCRNSNLSVESEDFEKILLNNWFFVFFGLWLEKPVFLQENFWQGCRNYFLHVQRNTYGATFWKGNRENLGIFGWFLKFSGQWRRTFFRFDKTAIDVQREQFIEKRFQKRKIQFFSVSERLFTLSEKKSARFAEPAIYVSVEAFGDFFLKVHKSFTLLWNFFQKTLSWEIIFRVVTTAMRAYRGYFWGKKKYLKQSYFCSSVLKFEQFFCLLTKKSGCQRNNLLLQKKNGQKRLCKNYFLFKSISDFE